MPQTRLAPLKTLDISSAISDQYIYALKQKQKSILC